MIVDLMFGEEAQEVAQVAELQDEVQEVAQVTKLRDGAESGTVRRSATSEPVLELIDVFALGDDQSDRIDDVSLAVRPGQILGIAGVDGNGQRALAEAIAGQRRLTGGEIRLGGRSIGRLSVSARQRLGLRYVSDDRLGEGIVTSLSVAVNLVLKRIGQPPYWRRGVMQRGKVDALARQLVASFDVRTPGVKARAGTLSGGNLQKVLLARELSFDPTVVVYHKPTQGLDIKTTQAVRQLISEQADAGVAAIVISPDLDEILEICDHIAVLYRGRIAGAVENRAGASERIGRLMLGGPAQVGCAEAGLD
jgi:simple sugar transport system ATP-binding protein